MEKNIKEEGVYVHSSVTLLYSRDGYIINQLYFSNFLKFNKLKKKIPHVIEWHGPHPLFGYVTEMVATLLFMVRVGSFWGGSW